MEQLKHKECYYKFHGCLSKLPVFFLWVYGTDVEVTVFNTELLFASCFASTVCHMKKYSL